MQCGVCGLTAQESRLKGSPAASNFSFMARIDPEKWVTVLGMAVMRRAPGLHVYQPLMLVDDRGHRTYIDARIIGKDHGGAAPGEMEITVYATFAKMSKMIEEIDATEADEPPPPSEAQVDWPPRPTHDEVAEAIEMINNVFVLEALRSHGGIPMNMTVVKVFDWLKAEFGLREPVAAAQTPELPPGPPNKPSCVHGQPLHAVSGGLQVRCVQCDGIPKQRTPEAEECDHCADGKCGVCCRCCP